MTIATIIALATETAEHHGNVQGETFVFGAIAMVVGFVVAVVLAVRTLARKAALSRVGLPITAVDAPSVIHALAEAAQPLQWLTGPDREWLKRFMDNGDNPSGHIKDLAADLPPIIRLFDHSLVLDYQNREYELGDVIEATLTITEKNAEADYFCLNTSCNGGTATATAALAARGTDLRSDRTADMRDLVVTQASRNEELRGDVAALTDEVRALAGRQPGGGELTERLAVADQVLDAVAVGDGLLTLK